MNKILLGILFVTFGFVSLHSEVYHEKFDEINNKWWTGETEGYSVSFENGSLILNKLTDGFIYFPYTLAFDEEKDYSIRAEMTQLSGITNHGYGIIWGTSDVDNLYYFIVSGNQMYSVFKSTENGWVPIKEWTDFESIETMGTKNVIEIVQKNKRLYFNINNYNVFDTTGVDFFGDYVGFAVNNKMKVAVDDFKVNYEIAKINLVPNPVLNVEKENLGANINTQYDEVTPKISSDGKRLYFCKKNDPENIGDEDQDDILYSDREDDGTWRRSVRPGLPINNAENNAVVSVSPDGNTLILMNQYTEDGSALTGGGLSISYKTVDGWSVPKDITIRNFYNNHPSGYASYCFSADNKVLIMTATRNDSYGLNDIYVAFREDEFTFSKPVNIGPVVNTFAQESTPFLAADGKTLYFASYGHPGYGSSDIFITKRLDDSWLAWSEPQNLGTGINSSSWDAYFTIPASGEYAYMVSEENSFGKSDIVKVKLTEDSKPDPVVIISGKVYDSKTSEPLDAEIAYSELASDKNLGTALSDPKNGEYKIVLPYGKNYSFLASKQGFYSVSNNIDLTEISEYKEIVRDLYLTPIEIGGTFRLNNIFFDYDKSELKTESYPELNRLIDFLTLNADISIEIGGHTDNMGSDTYNLSLSENRAKSVAKYLIEHGITNKRVVSKGYGESNPVAENETDEGRQLNRRVEFIILTN